MTATPSRPSIAQRANRYAVLAALVFGMAVGCNYSVDDAPAAQVVEASTVEVAEPREDDPGFDCRIHGNEVCGPTGEHTPGCYSDGVLVLPWSDELRGLAESPCAGVTGTYEVPGGVLTVFDDRSARFVPVAGGVEMGRPLVGCDRTAGACVEGELTGVDRDGRLMVAQDLNGDGVVAGDVEMGS